MASQSPHIAPLLPLRRAGSAGGHHSRVSGLDGDCQRGGGPRRAGEGSFIYYLLSPNHLGSTAAVRMLLLGCCGACCWLPSPLPQLVRPPLLLPAPFDWHCPPACPCCRTLAGLEWWCCCRGSGRSGRLRRRLTTLRLTTTMRRAVHDVVFFNKQVDAFPAQQAGLHPLSQAVHGLQQSCGRASTLGLPQQKLRRCRVLSLLPACLPAPALQAPLKHKGLGAPKPPVPILAVSSQALRHQQRTARRRPFHGTCTPASAVG